MTPRVVLDTNVVVAGLRSRLGASHRLLSLVGTGRFVHVISVALLFEYETAVTRPQSRIALPPDVIDDVLEQGDQVERFLDAVSQIESRFLEPELAGLDF